MKKEWREAEIQFSQQKKIDYKFPAVFDYLINLLFKMIK